MTRDAGTPEPMDEPDRDAIADTLAMVWALRQGDAVGQYVLERAEDNRLKAWTFACQLIAEQTTDDADLAQVFARCVRKEPTP
jgi:hypothetical protein